MTMPVWAKNILPWLLKLWPWVKKILIYIANLLVLTLVYFLVEFLGGLILYPDNANGLNFGLCWSMILAVICLLLPSLAGRIFFGVTYYAILLWTLSQAAYNSVFSRMMWLTDIAYAGEGAGYIGDLLATFPRFLWIGGTFLVGVGAAVIWKFPKKQGILWRVGYIGFAIAGVVGLCLLPESVFVRDNDVWGTRSEYAQSSSWRATYNTMYDAKKVYNICGIYHLTARDIWINTIYPLTPAYQKALDKQKDELDAYFASRGDGDTNSMTGAFAGKNVVLVLMESMDDWMITQEDTPTLCKLMEEGVNFTEFYTPGFGTARTINSEFCVNTGIYLPTNGNYLFDFVTNAYDQSIASQLTANGYSAEVFHYNNPEFYSRGVFEEAMGYNKYNSYEDYTDDKNSLYDDCLLFEIPELKNLFFRAGQTFNTIITRSAHLSYKYNEVLSHYALQKYPQYRYAYSSEEEACARVKAKLVDDLFARLLLELEAAGQLENTVIIGVTDHYTYGYKNMEELYAHSGVEDTLLLEKTPCFVWSADCDSLTVDKTLNTSDFLPTMLNLLGIDSPYNYLGRDAFDDNYTGYALFPDGSWICNDAVYTDGKLLSGKADEEFISMMNQKVMEYIRMSNLLLTSDYYAK
jgi:phosphoglycerol transferase MdoB-like AlkP superfamily enzyme